MTSEYKRRGGGGYNTIKKEEGKTKSQKHLDTWTKEEWQTKEGSGTARQDDDSRKRYLPKKVWEKLSEKKKKGTGEKKLEESQGGTQFVGNSADAKQGSREGSTDVGDEGEKAEENSEDIRRNGEADKKGTKRNKSEKTEDKKKDNKKGGAESKLSAKQDEIPKKKRNRRPHQDAKSVEEKVISLLRAKGAFGRNDGGAIK
ncbi:unnamed protein product [Penicillium viridicatum]